MAAYDAFSASTLDAFADACAALGGPDAATCRDLVANAWAAQRAFLVTAASSKKPAKPEDLMAVMKQCGVVDACQAAGKVRRGDPRETGRSRARLDEKKVEKNKQGNAHARFAPRALLYIINYISLLLLGLLYLGETAEGSTTLRFSHPRSSHFCPRHVFFFFFAQAAKRGAFELHFKAVSESLGCLNWLLVAPMPREIVEAQLGSADYSANKCVRALFRREAKRERERLWVKEAIC